MLMMLTLGLLEIEEVRRVVRERKSSWGSFCLLLMISLIRKWFLMGISKIIYNEHGNANDDHDYMNDDNHEKTAPASDSPAPRSLKFGISIAKNFDYCTSSGIRKEVQEHITQRALI